MHIQLSPGAPVLAQAAVASVLVMHVAAGGSALLAGGAALVAPKGEALHRRAGNMFFVCMLFMLTVGGIVAPFLPQVSSSVSAVFVIYLVATGWMTVRRPAGRLGRFERVAVAVPLVTIPALLVFAWIGAHSPDGLVEGVPYQASLVMASVAAFAAALDLRMIRMGGVAGPQRLARHVWRMGFALVMAAASFYPGQADVFPAWLRHTQVLLIPVLGSLTLTIFWLVRIQLKAAARRASLRGPLQPV